MINSEILKKVEKNKTKIEEKEVGIISEILDDLAMDIAGNCAYINDIDNFIINKENELIYYIQLICTDGIPEKSYIKLNYSNVDDFILIISRIYRLCTKGIAVIKDINKLIEEKQLKDGSTIALKYKWGIGESKTIVFEWNYDIIKIRLSEGSIEKLIEIEDIVKLVSSTDTVNSITEFIRNYNNMEISLDISSRLYYENIENALMQNMLSTKDMLSIVNKHKGMSGVQVVTTAANIRELGNFIVLCKWEIDYNKKDISLKILNNVMLDVDTGKIIKDSVIIDKVKNKLQLSYNIIQNVFI